VVSVPAAKIIGHVGAVNRFPTEHHVAGYTGSAPWTPNRHAADRSLSQTGERTPTP
jgi:hypothetical protein